MTVLPGIWWEPAYRGGRVEELEPTECRRLLDSANVRRLGFCSLGQQRIVPINLVVSDDYVVFRASPDMERELLGQNPRLTRRFESAASRQRERHDRRQVVHHDMILQLVIGLALIVSAVAIFLGAFGQAVGWAMRSGSAAVMRHWQAVGKSPSERGAHEPPDVG